MAKDTDKNAMTLRLPTDLDKWFTEEAARLGVPKHSMIVMSLQNTRTQSSAVVG
tara:strand:- start:1059 stop:1220 length:162 start_codon:yes stop_codon:yes gene_type:complete